MAQKCTKIILNFASSISGMPFQYDWTKGTMEVFQNPVRLAVYKLHAFLCLAHVGFEVFQLQKHFKIYMEKDETGFYLHAVWSSAYAFVFGFHVHVLSCMNEISNAMNQFHRLNRQFQSKMS